MHHALIERRSQTTDRTSPWEGISFVHDVDSDDLADALRTAFPRYRTLPERKLAAIIEFFQHELDGMPHSITTPISVKTPLLSHLPGTSPTAPNTPMETDDGNQSVAPSYSPASLSNSAVFQDSKIRHSAVQAPLSRSLPADPTLAATSTQFVFSSLDGRSMQPKTKRKMTVEERLAYKETRKRGACLKCKRQKGKVGTLNPATVYRV